MTDRTARPLALLQFIRTLSLFLLLIVTVWISNICLWIQRTQNEHAVSVLSVLPIWFASQIFGCARWQETSWRKWEAQYQNRAGVPLTEPVPTIDLSGGQSEDEILPEIWRRFGSDWRSSPLLLKHLWAPEELNSTSRRFSLQSLLNETEIELRYFTNASKPGALIPDGFGRISDIMYNITQLGKPHKLGTQQLLQLFPESINEISKPILTTLFGDHFEYHHLLPSFFGLVAPLTTVQIFVAPDGSLLQKDPAPRTDLHCEPIGDVSVQLEGSKVWTIVDTKYSFRLRPLTARRPYMYSQLDEQRLKAEIPHYHVVTEAGDALWIPTWMWHRVDYSTSEASVSIAAAIFHFRWLDFLVNQPLHALMVLPSIISESMGLNPQY